MRKKNIFNSTILSTTFLIVFTSLTSCSDDDENPEVVNEEEIITTMNVTLSASGVPTITLQSQDLDGDGPNDPVVEVSGNLTASTVYSGSIELLNETETPAEDITEEVAEEADEHQFIFVTSGSVASTAYNDEDADGNPIGIAFTLTTGEAGTGTLQITLRHEPKKPNDGTLADAGGETDVVQTFTVTVE
ncbi:type 1 periplasmic binding fold superfamily protein [Aurantibacter crassamenti]|uniref:type 1 periplasmic binding fold superfamily protein n=1 Tax=Aurantibacter crassamenti TaxID=1837375 RepID=UPI00193986C9|nr:type 1 periplasmic binding fold superfamily protein [Aurantibacter crassamenti]MBM1106898.1 type 1 periplasmic binding fold superfamily protein [Aurantibacter crassamenti]